MSEKQVPESSILTFIDEAVPEVTVDDIDGWSDDARSAEAVDIVMVQLDPIVADCNYDEFCDAAFTTSEVPFDCLVEVYDRPGTRNAVFRVSGARVPDSPRYYLDSLNAVLVLHGAFSRENTAVALYDPDLFEASAHKYIDEYRLFDAETRENRTDEIRHGNSIIDWIHSGSLQEDIEKLNRETDGDLNEYIYEHNTSPTEETADVDDSDDESVSG